MTISKEMEGFIESRLIDLGREREAIMRVFDGMDNGVSAASLSDAQLRSWVTRRMGNAMETKNMQRALQKARAQALEPAASGAHVLKFDRRPILMPVKDNMYYDET